MKYIFQAGPIGVVLGDGIEEDNNKEIFVEVISKSEGSAADKEETLLIGDRIVRIGRKHVEGLGFEHVMQVLKAANRPIELAFLRPKVKQFDFYFNDGPMGMTLGDDFDDYNDDEMFVEVVKKKPGKCTSLSRLF